MRKLLIFTSLLETALGFFLLILPSEVIYLVLGTETTKSMEAFCRLSGATFVCLGIACFPSKGETEFPNSAPSVRAMFAYNLFAGIYLGYLKFAAGYDGILLLPACLLHIAITIYFVFLMFMKSKN